MKDELVGMISAFLGGGMILLITRSGSYQDANGNTLLIVLLLFFVCMVGLGIGKLFSMFDGEATPKKAKSTKKKPFGSDDFIGDGMIK